MQFSTRTIVVLAAIFASATSANPVQLQADHAKVSSFSTDLCGGEEQVFEVTGSGSDRCINVLNKRSIKVAVKH